MTVEIAAGTADASAVAMGTTVATSPRGAGAAAHGASATNVLADGGHDHHRGARLSACPADRVHGLHLHSRFSRRPHGQRVTRGTGRSCSNPIGASPRGQTYVPVLINQNHLGYSLVSPYLQGLEFSFCSIVRVIFRLENYFFLCTSCL